MVTLSLISSPFLGGYVRPRHEKTMQDLDVHVEKFTSVMLFYSFIVQEILGLNLNFLAWVTQS